MNQIWHCTSFDAVAPANWVYSDEISTWAPRSDDYPIQGRQNCCVTRQALEDKELEEETTV